jgi:lysophospholipase L1-like esterase
MKSEKRARDAFRGKRVFIGVMISLPFLLGAGWSGCDRCDTGHCNLVPQETRADKILAVGDSFTAYYSRKVSGCCQSYTDYASIEIDEFIQNEAVGGTQISGGPSPTIPQQYANAMADNGPYDVVILAGGGNDLTRECPVTSQPCSIACAPKKQEIADEMGALITQMVADGSHVLLVGGVLSSVFSLSPTSEWYNECWLLDTSGRDYADSHPNVTYVSSRDLANPNGRADYGIDGVHPSISLTQKIGKRVGGVLEQILATLD